MLLDAPPSSAMAAPPNGSYPGDRRIEGGVGAMAIASRAPSALVRSCLH